MTSTATRHLMVGLMMTVLVGAGRPAFAAAGDTPAVSPFGGPQGRRVRSGSVAITALIQQASEGSKTFRGHDALYFFYQQAGSNSNRAFETAAAIRAGDMVGAELRQPSPRPDVLARTR